MKLRGVLVVAFLLLASSAASAQGLIAFPWKECPKLVVTAEFRCVWVAAAAEITPIRPREHTDRTFEMRFLNPGSDPANVVFHVFSTAGDPLAAVSGVVGAGALQRRITTDVIGYMVLQSDRPLLVWAWGWEEKLATGGAAEDRPPTAMHSHGIQVIPIDCTLAGEESKNFSFVCGVTEPPK